MLDYFQQCRTMRGMKIDKIKFKAMSAGACWMLVMLLLLPAGCGNYRTTYSQRTATEQFLLSKSARTAVEKLDFQALAGRRVFVNSEYMVTDHQPYVLAEVRRQMMLAGAQVANQLDEADVVMEVHCSGHGIDEKTFFVGIPPLLSFQTADGSYVAPEFGLLKSTGQKGMAGLSYIAYWRNTGEVMARSGPVIGGSYREDWLLFGFTISSTGDIPPAESTSGD